MTVFLFATNIPCQKNSLLTLAPVILRFVMKALNFCAIDPQVYGTEIPAIYRDCSAF